MYKRRILVRMPTPNGKNVGCQLEPNGCVPHRATTTELILGAPTQRPQELISHCNFPKTPQSTLMTICFLQSLARPTSDPFSTTTSGEMSVSGSPLPTPRPPPLSVETFAISILFRTLDLPEPLPPPIATPSSVSEPLAKNSLSLPAYPSKITS